MTRLMGIGAIGVQVAGVLATFAALALWPPADGLLLLVPLTTAAARRLPAVAMDHGALIVSRGPLAGSLVVTGARAAMTRVPGFLVIAAPPSLCGAGARRA